MKEEKKQKIIWNFDNVVSEEEQIKRIEIFNDTLIDIISDYYIKQKNNTLNGFKTAHNVHNKLSTDYN